MDPLFLELPGDLDGQTSPYNASNILQREGVPQESKLATYLRNRDIQTNQTAANLETMSEKISQMSDTIGSFERDPLVTTNELRNALPDEWKPISRVPDNPSPITSQLLGSFGSLSGLVEPTSALTATTASDSLATFAESSLPVSSSKFASEDSSAVSIPTFQENVGGTTYFYKMKSDSGLSSSREPTPSIYSQYSLSSSHSGSRSNHIDPSGLEDELRYQMLTQQAITNSHLDPGEYKNIPQEVDLFYELVPLEHLSAASKPMMNYATSVYKATHIKTGQHHCLYRVHQYTVSSLKVTQIFDAWKQMKHSGLVPLQEVFTTKAFGDKSIIFVYEYFPGAETLDQKYLSNGYSKTEWECLSAGSTDGGPNVSRMLAESTLWNFIIQLSGVIRTIHSQGLSCRTLTPSKILLTENGTRVRLNCCAIISVLSFDANSSNLAAANQSHQQDDLTNLGKLMIALACRSYVSIQRDNLAVAIELMGRTYSRDLSMLCVCLLGTQRAKTINDIMPMIGARFYGALDTAMTRVDTLETELSKEVENGRLFRLVAKLSCIIDRAHLKADPSWSETGDKYMLKLFQDYVFHQHTEDGKPWMDMGHMVSTLNKLDCGSPDKICLMSHNQQNVLVVSYKELKHAFERSFQEILQSGSIPKSSIKQQS